jgi:hypothetical protein
MFVWWSISPVNSKLILWEIFICHSYKYTTMTLTMFVWLSISPVNSKLILWEVFICHSCKYTTMTLTLFVWWSISPDRPPHKHGQSHGGVLIAVTNEYFPQDQFTVYRTDRPPNKQGQSHGGVLIAVTYEYFLVGNIHLSQL